jgi:hypothetical protein
MLFTIKIFKNTKKLNIKKKKTKVVVEPPSLAKWGVPNHPKAMGWFGHPL